MLLNGVAPPQGERMNIDDITGQLVQHMQQNNGLQPLGNAQPITVDGISKILPLCLTAGSRMLRHAGTAD